MNLVSEIVSARAAGPTVEVIGVLIQDPVHHPKDVFVAHVTFKHGDADGRTTRKITFHRNQIDLLLDFLRFCERCSREYPNGRGGYEGYDHIEGYDRWVNRDDGLTLSWPYDPYCDDIDDIMASFESVRVHYFDSNGVECNVGIQVEVNANAQG